MNLRRPLLPVACLLLALAAAAGSASAAESFGVAAIGCVPYGRAPDSRAAFLRLIAEINRHSPVFTVHLGDILGGDESPTDSVLLQRRDDFNTFDGPLIYTPGDNEWTDSWTPKVGGFNPLERLAKVREIFFPREESLGRHPLALVTQRRDARFAKFVENARWTHEGVVFATIHVVGSSNNNQPRVPGSIEEAAERDAADTAWLRATFAEARATKAPGVALFFQSDPFAADLGRAGYAKGYENLLHVLEEESRRFARPVLLVHADEHRYRLDRGMRFEMNAAPLPNVTRIETFGDRNVHGVFITVDPDSTDVFLPGPLIVPGTQLPRLPPAKH